MAVRRHDGAALVADGVVLTGAGPAIEIVGQPRGHPRVLDGRSYWLHEKEFKKHFGLNVCVIGSGETAASIVISLLKKLYKGSTVDVLTSRGVLYSRGESFDENRFYSDPGDWPRLAETHRREFLERTDPGGLFAAGRGNPEPIALLPHPRRACRCNRPGRPPGVGNDRIRR
jgi:mycobactin lysine-N-oxygenase